MQFIPATLFSLGMALISTSYPTTAIAGQQPYGECLIASADTDVPEIEHGLLKGYLNQQDLPDSLQLLPAPPTLGNSDHVLDNTISQRSFSLPGTPRWDLAATDADLNFPGAAGTFSCAMGIPISEEATPRLYMLLRRSLTDAGLSTYAAKNNYNRRRPFLVNKKMICSPQDTAVLTTDPSYPSGHTAIGWAWALILSEMVPERSDEILARGLAFGESRHLCNVHWYSDVINGQLMGAASVALLHANPQFRSDFAAAKAEVSGALSRGYQPNRDCRVEAAALAQDTLH